MTKNLCILLFTVHFRRIRMWCRDLGFKTCVGWLIRHDWRCISSAWKIDMILFLHYIPHILQECDFHTQQVTGWLPCRPNLSNDTKSDAKLFSSWKSSSRENGKTFHCHNYSTLSPKGYFLKYFARNCGWTAVFKYGTIQQNQWAQINNSWVVLMLQSGGRIVLCCDKDGKIERSDQV